MRKLVSSLFLAGMALSLSAQQTVKIGWFGAMTGRQRPLGPGRKQHGEDALR